MMDRMVEIIAEIGSSPAPKWEFDDWCIAAAGAGATHIKAQMFYAEHFPRVEWESKQPLEFPRERLEEFVKCAHKFHLRAGVSVFDVQAVRMADQCCDFIKQAAREQDNHMLRAIINYRNGPPAKQVYRSVSCFDALQYTGDVTLFAIQEYPTRMSKALMALVRWAWMCRNMYGHMWGWSSHTRGTLDCIAAAKLGANAIEKHLALKPSDIEAGHSLLPEQFGKMARRING